MAERARACRAEWGDEKKKDDGPEPFQAAAHMQLAVAVGATSNVACIRSKPWVSGDDGVLASAKKEPRCHLPAKKDLSPAALAASASVNVRRGANGKSGSHSDGSLQS